MRKGAWLNKPVIIHQRPATNRHDVEIARLRAAAEMSKEMILNSSYSYSVDCRQILKTMTTPINER